MFAARWSAVSNWCNSRVGQLQLLILTMHLYRANSHPSMILGYNGWPLLYGRTTNTTERSQERGWRGEAKATPASRMITSQTMESSLKT